MSDTTKEATKQQKHDVDDEDAKEDAEELVNQTKTAKEQGKSLAAMNEGSAAVSETLDASKAQQAMTLLSKQSAATKEAQTAQQKELDAIKVRQEDIDLVAAEFELSADKAERQLRIHKGDLAATLKALVQA